MKTYSISNRFLTAQISEKGGELRSLKDKNRTEYIWQGADGLWGGSSPNLFPVCGRLTDGHFVYDGKEYRLPIHGFLKDRRMKLISSESSSLTLGLDTGDPENSDIADIYPFPFSLVLKISLDGSRLDLNYIVTAKKTPLYFSYGGHPGFNLPVDGKGKFSDWIIEFGKECEPRQIEITPNGFCGEHLEPLQLTDSRILPLDHSLFDIEGVFLRNTARSVKLRRAPDKTFSGSPVITVSFPDCMTLGLWHDAGKPAPFLCIEPWHGSPDTDGVPCDITTKADMISLAPGGSFSGGYSIEIDAD